MNIEPQTISSIAAILSSLFSGIAVFFTFKTITSNRVATIHSQFQNDMRKIQEHFKYPVNQEEIWNPTEEEKRYMTLYWYLVFDEWFICMYLHKWSLLNRWSIRRLWTKHYIEGVKSALTRTHFKNELISIFSKKSAFLGKREEFKKELERIYLIICNNEKLGLN